MNKPSTRKHFLLIAAFAACLALTGCGQAGSTQASAAETSGAKAADPAIVEWMASYKSWTQVTALHVSTTHWQQGVISYVNRDPEIYAHNHAMSQLALMGADEIEIEEEGGFKTYAPGTVVAKENYTLDDSSQVVALDSVTFMLKLEPGTLADEQGGEWRYSQVAPDGSSLLDGHGDDPVIYQRCAKCHSEVANRDFVFHQFYELNGESKS